MQVKIQKPQITYPHRNGGQDSICGFSRFLLTLNQDLRYSTGVNRKRRRNFMVSVCDDCRKKSICKPSRPYSFMCQWKDADGKQRIAARDEWGLTAISNKFVAQNEEEGWVAVKWSIDDIDACIKDAGYNLKPELSNSEKMELLKTMVRKQGATKETSYRVIDFLLRNMYGDRIVDTLEESA